MSLIGPNCPEGVCQPDALGFDCPHQLEREHTMTITATDAPTPSAPVLPTERTHGLGELIYQHRVYMGISQRAMATRLEFDRRDYQRIEQGRNACPVGFLSRVMALVDEFDSAVEAVLDAAVEAGGITVLIDLDPKWEWERNVAGRAAVDAQARKDHPRVTLTIMGTDDVRSSR